jgi:hypothetical protein
METWSVGCLHVRLLCLLESSLRAVPLSLTIEANACRLCNACGIRHARVMKKVQRQHALRLGVSPGCTPPLPDEPDECRDDSSASVASPEGAHTQQQHQQESHDQREAWPEQLQLRSSVYDLLN